MIRRFGWKSRSGASDQRKLVFVTERKLQSVADPTGSFDERSGGDAGDFVDGGPTGQDFADSVVA